MKKTIAQQFLAHQSATSNGNSWANANGGNLANSPGNFGSKPVGWNANGAATAGPAAMPYVMTISNSSATPVSSFSLLGANQFLNGNYGGGSWSAAGNFILNGVTISMGYGTTSGQINYQSFLGQTQQKNFTCGGVYLQVVTGNNAQASDPYNVSSVDGTGTRFVMPQFPLINPMQQQSNVVTQNTQFNIDGNTVLNWDTVYASTVFKVYIYPSVVINPTNVLNGANPQMTQGAPKPFGFFN